MFLLKNLTFVDTIFSHGEPSCFQFLLPPVHRAFIYLTKATFLMLEVSRPNLYCP